jgi:glycerophosphoryl diester phosphodiesterase
MTFDEIRKSNFAFRYNDTKFVDKYGFQPAPALEEVYELLAPTGMFVNVELKSTEEELLKKCNELADRYKMKGKVLYSSFDHRALMRIHKYDPEVTVAPLYAQRIQFPWVYAGLLGAMAIHPDWGQVFDIPDIVSECHMRGIRLNVWTVDGEDAMHKLIEAGADSLITDVPDIARKVVGEYYEL